MVMMFYNKDEQYKSIINITPCAYNNMVDFIARSYSTKHKKIIFNFNESTCDETDNIIIDNDFSYPSFVNNIIDNYFDSSFISKNHKVQAMYLLGRELYFSLDESTSADMLLKDHRYIKAIFCIDDVDKIIGDIIYKINNARCFGIYSKIAKPHHYVIYSLIMHLLLRYSGWKYMHPRMQENLNFAKKIMCDIFK